MAANKVVVDYAKHSLEEDANITVAPDQYIEVKLSSNPSTGYTWSLDANRRNNCGVGAIELMDVRYVQDDAPRGYVGVPGVHTYTFRVTDAAVKGSKCRIAMTYGRSWEHTLPAIEKKIYV